MCKVNLECIREIDDLETTKQLICFLQNFKVDSVVCLPSASDHRRG